MNARQLEKYFEANPKKVALWGAIGIVGIAYLLGKLQEVNKPTGAITKPVRKRVRP